MNSLQRHLQLGLALSLIILIGLFWVLGNQSIKSITEDFVVTRLEHDGNNLLASLSPEPMYKLRWRQINPIYNQSSSGHYYVIRFANGRQIYSPSFDEQTLSFPSLEPGQSKLMRVEGPFGQPLLLWIKGFQKENTKVTIAVAEDLTTLKQQRNKFKRTFAILAIVGLLILLAVQSLVVRRAMKKLEPVKDDIKRLEHGKTSKLSEDVPAEILPVIQEFNHILKLLAQRLERSRNALGNLTHALKGPLSILTQYHDTAEEGMDKDQVKLASTQTERIRQLMERELKRARLAGKDMPVQRFNPKQDLPDLINVLNQIHRTKSLDIQYHIADEVPPFGDLEDIHELLGNLLDNACKWAAAAVHCNLTGHDQIQITIEDDGRGLSSQELDQLSQRGVRLDESVEGHGLGLSIAKDIINVYGGKLLFSPSQKLGGLKIKVILPLV